MLAIEAVSKEYPGNPIPAIDSVSIQVNPGKVVGLIGPNGAGKTTTLRVACGVCIPNSGRVDVDGIDLDLDKAAASRIIGWVPEQPIHDSSLNVGALLRYYSDISGQIPYRVGMDLLDVWGLADHKRKRFRELSLGLKKRFSIVVASLNRPRYFLLDEPFNGLDPIATVQYRNWIHLLRESGSGVLLSSHNLREVQALCDDVVVINRGRIAASSSVSDIATRTSTTVVVVLNRVDPEALRILERFGKVTVSENVITIRGAGIDTGELSSKLVEGGYRLKGLTTDEGNLEEYFLRTIRNDR
ncbi:MAG: ABC transporter ATP-binding protein [Thermoplasmata archaeon]